MSSRGAVNIVLDNPARPFSHVAGRRRSGTSTGSASSRRIAKPAAGPQPAPRPPRIHIGQPRQRGPPCRHAARSVAKSHAAVSEREAGTTHSSCASAAERKPTTPQRPSSARLSAEFALSSNSHTTSISRAPPCTTRWRAPGSIPRVGGRNAPSSTTSYPRSATAAADSMEPTPPVTRIRPPEGKGHRHRPEDLRPVAHAGVGGVEWEV